MKKLFFLLNCCACSILLFIAGAGCNEKKSSPKTSHSTASDSTVNKTADSSVDKKKAQKQITLPQKNKQAASQNTDTLAVIRVGEHDITHQSIGWDYPGKATIHAPHNGWYKIKGGQRSRRGTDYLKIDGYLKPVSSTELLFKGIIELQVAHLNNGKPCVRTGHQIFKTTKNRKYWRLQQMLNCQGVGIDYIDIYF